jgi:hypothetical protein
MGADLYNYSVFNALQAQYQSKFEAAIELRNSAKSEKQKQNAQHQIEKLYDAMHPASAYFRDSYNGYSLLAQLGMSWWRDVLPKLDVNDQLPLKDVKWLQDEVRTRLLFCQASKSSEQEVAVQLLAGVSGSSENSDIQYQQEFSAEDVEYFLGRKMALILFLQTSLDKEEPPVCSL